MGKKADAPAAATEAKQEPAAPPAAEATKGADADVDAVALEAANKVLADEATQLDELAKSAEATVKGTAKDDQADDKAETATEAATEPDAQTAVFLRQKKLEQKQRERLALEQREWDAKKRELEQKEYEWAQRAKQLEERESKLSRVIDGDYLAAVELTQGKDPRKFWDGMAKASSPEAQREVEFSSREKAIMDELSQVKGYLMKQQQQAAQAEEARLEGLALEHMFDEEACPTVCAHLNPKHPMLREVALKLYKDTASRYVEEHGIFDLRGVAIEVERDMRKAYAAEHKGSNQTRTPSGASVANGTAKPISLSVSKLAGRESVPRSVDEMSEEERTRVAIEAANRMMRTA